MGAAILGPDAPPAWRDQLVRSLTEQLPEELSAEQAAAWAELHDLLDDPAFIATMQERVSPFWEFVRTRRSTPTAGTSGCATSGGGRWPPWTLARRRRAAETQAVAADYAALFAGALGQPCTPEFVRGFAETMSRSIDDRSRRLEELVALLRSDEVALRQVQANHLLLAGLQWWAARLEPDTPDATTVDPSRS